MHFKFVGLFVILSLSLVHTVLLYSQCNILFQQKKKTSGKIARLFGKDITQKMVHTVVKEIFNVYLDLFIPITAGSLKCSYVHPSGGWTYYFCFFRRRRPASGHLVSAHLKEKYLSYLYQIWYGCLLG